MQILLATCDSLLLPAHTQGTCGSCFAVAQEQADRFVVRLPARISFTRLEQVHELLEPRGLVRGMTCDTIQAMSRSLCIILLLLTDQQ